MVNYMGNSGPYISGVKDTFWFHDKRRLGLHAKIDGNGSQAEISKSVLRDAGKPPNGQSVGSYLLEWNELHQPQIHFSNLSIV
ncbi:predicted protein [Sclerotinia sclerotiorum 1980 UF-70]|uniref:Uncharacterized protein n=1 Tax=Sclerotinia sclerotiorum (strain ATCC 18683 / 1980 / Ss-1) TaxID=665079 RepID=A7E687_SCLS1|nr:predicted protein [Sclerotinia sclerotiorum 1980 UF-70]EDN91409.1 predicted protein [Sclerotinia sclerotiorum 1980 UF-70]